MNEELKQFDINIEDIEFSENLLDNIHEAINKMKLHTLSDRFEIVLNNNLIETKEKLTNFRTILGCRISYDNLDKNISFIIKEDNKPSYEELEKENQKLNKVIDELEKFCNEEIKEWYKADFGEEIIDNNFRQTLTTYEFILKKLNELKTRWNK